MPTLTADDYCPVQNQWSGLLRVTRVDEPEQSEMSPQGQPKQTPRDVRDQDNDVNRKTLAQCKAYDAGSAVSTVAVKLLLEVKKEIQLTCKKATKTNHPGAR